MLQEKDDNRIVVPWKRAVSTKYLFDIYTKARYALIDAGKNYLVEDMKKQIQQSGSQRETLDIIKRFVRFG